MGIEGISPTTLVQVTVQADWTDVVTEVLRLNSTGSPSVHGNAKVSVVGDRKVQFTGEDGVVLEGITNYSFKVKVPEYGEEEIDVYGTARRTDIAKILCLDVSPEGALFVTGSEDGTIRIGEAESGRMTQELKGHVQYVNTCRFFPSGQVVLSGGGDFLLKIWSALDGSCPVTMKGHVKPSSNDGSVKLWEVASGATIRTLAQYDNKVNAIALDTWQTPLESKIPLDSREVGTEEKLVIAASESGVLYGLDVRAAEEAFRRKSYSTAPLRACAFSAHDSLVATGTSEGVVELFDIRKSDGLYEVKDITEPNVKVQREYVGYDLDGPVHASLVAGGPSLVSVSKEGGLLRFSGNLGVRSL
ncbi:Proteasomal ATPase-associated factor 1 [Mortierella sp. AD011]|nr:Proteasomal ATPase-associated factor 1 [Mortierella sp. AD011]